MNSQGCSEAEPLVHHQTNLELQRSSPMPPAIALPRKTTEPHRSLPHHFGNPPMDANDPEDTLITHWRENLAEALGIIARWHMPFGKYGPQHYPPNGVPLYDLPAEYL